MFEPVLGIRIWIRMFLSRPDPEHPDPLVTSTDPAPDPSIIKQNQYKKPLFLLFCDFFKTFYQCPGSASVCFGHFGSASGSVSQKFGSEDPDPDADPYQNVTDPQHCFEPTHFFQMVVKDSEVRQIQRRVLFLQVLDLLMLIDLVSCLGDWTVPVLIKVIFFL